MAGLRFADLQSRPTEFLDFTSLTLEEFQALIPSFEAAFQAHMAAWRLDGKPRTARRFTVYENCPLPTPGSCPCSLRLNTRSLPGDRHRSKKASTIGPTWRHSGPLHRDDALDAGRADTRRLLRPPSLAPSHHHGVLTDPLAGATAARERVAPLSEPV